MNLITKVELEEFVNDWSMGVKKRDLIEKYKITQYEYDLLRLKMKEMGFDRPKNLTAIINKKIEKYLAEHPTG